MSRICYIERSFYTKARAVVDQANAICEEYAAQGLDLTLRQLYYQFVARGLIANKQSEYDRLGSIVNDARLAGDLDWEFIVDRTRNLMGISHHDSPADLIRDAARRFHTDKWSNQPTVSRCGWRRTHSSECSSPFVHPRTSTSSLAAAT